MKRTSRHCSAVCCKPPGFSRASRRAAAAGIPARIFSSVWSCTWLSSCSRRSLSCSAHRHDATTRNASVRKPRTIGFFHPEHLPLAVGIIPPRSTFKTRIETEDRRISANSQGGSTTFQLPPLPRLPRRSTVKATECLIDVHLANEDQRRDKSPRAAAWTRWRLGVSVLRARVGKTLDFTFKTEPLPCVCRRRCSIVRGLLTLSPSQSSRAGLGVLIHPRSGAAAGPGLRAPIRSFVAPVQGQLP